MVSLLVMKHDKAKTLLTMEQIVDGKLAVCAPSFSDYNQIPVADSL